MAMSPSKLTNVLPIKFHYQIYKL